MAARGRSKGGQAIEAVVGEERWPQDNRNAGAMVCDREHTDGGRNPGCDGGRHQC